LPEARLAVEVEGLAKVFGSPSEGERGDHGIAGRGKGSSLGKGKRGHHGIALS